LLILSIAPWPTMRYRSRHRATDQVDAEARRIVVDREENRAAFHKLTQDSELSEWLAFRAPDNPLRVQALEGIRRLPRRQADAEELMRRGLDSFWEDVPELDLQATPVICERARHFLLERAERIEPYLPTFQWLVDQHCKCDPELAAIETAVQIYPDSPERNRVLAALTRIRQSR
jgi:hypothetical protein